ncbi:PIN domain-containing protein [Candidatus Woesearchaeota archaeon]|nr:PIN domain-containing protein [Candidatus Woesearchaeota archaeon]
MKIVVDTNILLSALIRDSTTREIVTSSKWEFFYPEVSLHEIRKYQQLVLEKTGLSKAAYEQLLAMLLDHVRLIPDEQLSGKMKEAKEIMQEIDPKDVVFIAAALAIPNSVVWSDDKDFDQQERVTTLKTKDIVEYYKGSKTHYQ